MSPAHLGRPTEHVDDDPAVGIEAAEPHSWRWAALLVLPYLLLGVAWTFTNPPGAAPDEPDNLVKAIGSRTLTAGEDGPSVPTGGDPLVRRNTSITRVYSLPGRFSSISQYTCYAFRPDVTAGCLPVDPPETSGTFDASTPIGAYPPFLFVPIGWLASLGWSTVSAFVLARLAVVALSSLLLLVGVRHLTRWLGRGAVMGVVAVLTPMAVYTTGVVSLSGIELMAAIGVASVVTVALRRPETVHLPATHWTLAATGACLALSRQLGAVTLAALILVLLFVTGWGRIRRLVTERQRSFVLTVGILFVSALAVAAWELTYDHPADTGPVFAHDAVGPFLDRSYGLMESAIGRFGWLDTPLPGQVTGLWITIWLVVVGGGALVARRREFWLILMALAGTWVLAFCIYASVFFTVGAGVQGRQFMPFAAFLFVAAGAILADHLRPLGREVSARPYVVLGLAAGISQFYAIFWNARRYAVGADGPLWFFDDAQWGPVLGWGIWIALGCAGGTLLTIMTIQSRPGPALGAAQKGVMEHVAR